MKAKNIWLLTAGVWGLLLGAAPAQAQVSFGHAEKCCEEWLFRLGDDSAALHPAYDDSRWTRVRLPHDWSVKQPLSPSLASCTGYLPGGIGWYRRHFTVDDSAARHYIYFEGIYNRSRVYLNGHLLGERPNGYVSFLYDMTPYLNKGDNVLAVRVDHSRYADSRWYTGSGIYRDAWIVAAPEIHLAPWGTAYRCEKLTDRRADIAVEFAVERHDAAAGTLEVRAALLDDTGKRVAEGKCRVQERTQGPEGGTLRLRVDNPRRWDTQDPYLYTLSVTLLRDGEAVDSCRIRAGLRTLDFDPDRGFALNGLWMKVKGVCLHHDAGVLGAAVPPEVWRRRLENLRAIGVNAIRMSHNPQAPVVYDLCDELGLLVMDEASDEWEFPKRKWIEGWNVGTPGFDGSYDFFEEWIERDVTDMVRRDRNHPSVFLWSIGNEVDYPNDPYSHPILDGSAISQPMFGGYNPEAPHAERIGRIAKRLAACVRAVDTSRPVTGALAGVVMSNETEYPEAVDVVGYNYTEDRYDADHAAYPDRIIYGSENRPDIDAWYAVRDREFIFGQFIWTGTDYLGESGPWPSRGF
ncbi:glycoside hydrolase family 2 TIM barrel-domain containing protein, partial [uncultured Alistipes sp.]|uniref:glycoside hydrolase family 2 TIM barrel-domain containing protein n=1 Tax=uncultured Alistipes sp. TaxID=538949 RepID=UPI0026333BE6